jgi:WD40 repeat protein
LYLLSRLLAEWSTARFCLGDNTVRLWNMRDGATKLLNEENPTFLDDPCYRSAVFSPDGRYVAASHRDGMVRIWDVCTGQLMRRMKAHMDWANCVAFMPDGKGLVSGGSDRKLRYWDVSSLDSTRFQARSRITKDSHRETPGMDKQASRPEWKFSGHEVC